ncbi:MAG: nucleotidyl transferase AbiEii/AbiGii toxin family protein [Saprospiraceae bacterium]
MQVLYGLQQQGYEFELKGGTSLSKGFGIIDRFSEDIDIHIHPPEEHGINENPKNNNQANIDARKQFYDQLAKEIKIDGILESNRDHAFDDTRQYRSGGVRLNYKSLFPSVQGVKEGILLEVGFDVVTPNLPQTISSWAYDRAIPSEIEIKDNRAKDVRCYDPRYTFVEKLQTIATKFRREQETRDEDQNFMRQYYDAAQLLKEDKIIEFIGTDEYQKHKQKRFSKLDLAIPISQNEAYLLNDPALRKRFKDRYQNTRNLYYRGQPDFEEVLASIHKYIDGL